MHRSRAVGDRFVKKERKKKKKNSEKLSLYEKIKKDALRTENRRKFKETLFA